MSRLTVRRSLYFSSSSRRTSSPGPPYTVARGGPAAPLRSGGSFASLTRAESSLRGAAPPAPPYICPLAGAPLRPAPLQPRLRPREGLAGALAKAGPTPASLGYGWQAGRVRRHRVAPRTAGTRLRAAGVRRLPAVARHQAVLGRHAARRSASSSPTRRKARSTIGAARSISRCTTSRTGREVEMPSVYDEMTQRAYPRLCRRSRGSAATARSIAARDGSGRLHGRTERVVALQLHGLAGLPNP